MKILRSNAYFVHLIETFFIFIEIFFSRLISVHNVQLNKLYFLLNTNYWICELFLKILNFSLFENFLKMMIIMKGKSNWKKQVLVKIDRCFFDPLRFLSSFDFRHFNLFAAPEVTIYKTVILNNEFHLCISQLLMSLIIQNKLWSILTL